MHFFKYLIFSFALLSLTACGGGSTKKDIEKNTPKDQEQKKMQIDITKAKIKLKGSDPYYLKLNDTYTEAGATVKDSNGTDISSLVTVNSNNVDTSVTGKQTITYTFTDKSGRTKTKKRTLIINNIVNSGKGVHVNEFLAANSYNNIDSKFGEFSDWIELYNYSDNDINIGGYYISDDKNQTDKYTIPDETIASHGYKIIWADNKTNTSMHANFKLSMGGDTIIFSDKNGNIIDDITFAKQKSDISASIGDNGISFFTPTFKAKNSIPYALSKQSKKPKFSLDSGFYNGVQSITLTQKNAGTIYYTTDGSIPTKNSTLYSSPIAISKTTVVRARALEDGKFFSKTRNRTYFIDEESTLPVVSLTIDKRYLDDEKIGIYTGVGSNGTNTYGCATHKDEPKSTYIHQNFNQNWKRPIHIALFDAETKHKEFSLTTSVAISGQCSRYRENKSLSFKLDNKYGDKSLKYPLYESKPTIQKVKDFKLRNGSSGFITSDIINALLVKSGNLNVDYQAHKAVRMFMNGKYWGIYNLREKKGTKFLKSNYPEIDEDNIDIMGYNWHGYVVKSGNREAFDNFYDYIKNNDLSKDSNYQKVISMIDEDNFIDYIMVMVYNGGQDWLHNNTRWWRERKDGGKWRWMLDDTDSSFKKVDQDNLAKLASTTHLFTSKLFTEIIKNSTFKTKFKNRFYEQLNTTFTKENLLPIIEKVDNERKAYFGDNNAKWNFSRSEYDTSVQTQKTFIENRTSFVKGLVDNL